MFTLSMQTKTRKKAHEHQTANAIPDKQRKKTLRLSEKPRREVFLRCHIATRSLAGGALIATIGCLTDTAAGGALAFLQQFLLLLLVFLLLSLER